MTIKLEIKDYHSADIEEVWEWKPSSDEEVYYSLEIDIGKVSDKKSSIFQLIVASPASLQSRAETEPDNIIVGRGYIIIENYQWDKIESRLNEIIRSCERKSLDESISCLQRYFIWEYEDHSFDN